MKKILVCAAICMAAGLFVWAEGAKESGEKFPSKPINVVVHSAAGGGSDVWARKVSALMEKEMGVKFVVSNKPGGNGGLAANFVWNQPHDGYTVLGASESAMTYVVNGAFDKNASVWDWLISGGSPGVVAVLKDSPYNTFDDLVAAARAKPETVSISNAGIGKLWHLKIDMIKKYSNVPFKHSPYTGSAPAIVALLSKEVDAVSCSAGEIAPYIESGDARALVMTENEPFEFKKGEKIPAVTEKFPELGKYLPMSQFLTLMYPSDVPQNAKAAFEKAFAAIMKSKDMKDFIREQRAVEYNKMGEAGRTMAVEMEKKFSWFTVDLGLAKVDPAKAGIARP